MKVVICTYGRAGKQTTWNNLPKDIRTKTVLVVQDREKHLYPHYPTLVLPPHIQTIGPTRQWVMDTLPDNKIVMLDDDLVFAVRRWDDRTRFQSLPPGANEISGMFGTLEELLNTRAVVGVAPREGGNRDTNDFKYNTRMMRFTAYRKDAFQASGARFDRIPVMEDFDVLLQMMRAGFDTILMNNWVQNQGGSNTEGGCSSYRTLEVQAEAANKLAELHPEFVTVVTKQTKTAWNGKERKDVRVQWKKARASYPGTREVSLLD